MPYLGNIPAENYASFDKQTITGDGGTSYTLTHPVGSAQEVAIFVNNVRQEPGVAYTVTGTALTMTGNVESTDDFYAIFIGKAVQTVEIPEKATNGDYDFDNGTLFVDAANNNVGVGTTSIEDFGGGHVTLEIAGSTTTQGGVFKTATSDSAGSGSSGTEMIMFTDSTNGGSVNVVTSDSLRFLTANTERGRFLAGGGLTFNGDTATANALDDYEEGTWTPAVTINDSTTGITYNAQEGAYTKVGRLVTLIATIHLSSKGSSSGGVKVTGLPFNIGDQLSTSSFNGFASVYFGGLATTTSQLQGWLDDGATHILMRHVGGSGETSVQGLVDTDLNNTSDFRFFIQYFV